MVNTGVFGYVIIISCFSFFAKTEPEHDDRKRMGMKVMLKWNKMLLSLIYFGWRMHKLRIRWCKSELSKVMKWFGWVCCTWWLAHAHQSQPIIQSQSTLDLRTRTRFRALTTDCRLRLRHNTPYSKMAADKLFFWLHVNKPSWPRQHV